jgi:ribosomal protein L29
MAKKINMKEKGTGELAELVSANREELRTIRFGGAGSRERNVKKQKSLRKDIARAMTEITAKGQAA